MRLFLADTILGTVVEGGDDCTLYRARSLYENMQQQQDAQQQAAPPVYQQPAPPPPQAAAPSSGFSSDDMAQLKQLGQLHESGVLTDAEFEAAKQKILG